MQATATLREMQSILSEIKDGLPPSEYFAMVEYFEKGDSERLWAALVGHTWEMFSVNDPERFDEYWIRLGITGERVADVLDACGRLVSMLNRDPGHA